MKYSLYLCRRKLKQAKKNKLKIITNLLDKLKNSQYLCVTLIKSYIFITNEETQTKKKQMTTTTTYTGKQYPQGKQTPTGLVMSLSYLS